MSFFLFILLILFLIIGWPLLRGWLYMQSIRRRVNDAFGGANGRQRQRVEQEEEDDGKIFDRTDGEYAEFEEVRGTVSQETVETGETRTVIEEQITDAEYEEIP